jgi:hypothetical protein
LICFGKTDTESLKETTLFKDFVLTIGSTSIAAGNEFMDDSQNINSLYDAVTRGKIKGLLRYSGQYRDSNLHSTPDSETPDPTIQTEKKQQY